MLRPLPRLAALCLAAWPALAAAQDDASSTPLPMTAPLLGAASNFGQGVQPGMLRNAVALGVTDLRDGLNWGLAQTRADDYDFSDPRAAYPRDVLDAGLSLSLTLNWGNPLWEGGDTPVTPEGIAAFGRFAGDNPSGLDRADKPDTMHVLVAHHRRSGHTIPRHDIDDAGRENLLAKLAEPQAGERGLLRSLDDDGVAGGERGCCLFGTEAEGMVERVDLGNYAIGLAQG